ncbi:PT domain-containing protein [Streptomyces sp. NPDC007971]|uniref:PT domain-containing protein n=1 Tax=Streptomyces sp. NPDC007971 TaxID=3364799 RepID=UPI0036E1BF5B
MGTGRRPRRTDRGRDHLGPRRAVAGSRPGHAQRPPAPARSERPVHQPQPHRRTAGRGPRRRHAPGPHRGTRLRRGPVPLTRPSVHTDPPGRGTDPRGRRRRAFADRPTARPTAHPSARPVARPTAHPSARPVAHPIAHP